MAQIYSKKVVKKKAKIAKKKKTRKNSSLDFERKLTDLLSQSSIHSTGTVYALLQHALILHTRTLI